MSVLFTRVVEALIYPPAGPLWLMLVGLVIGRKRRAAGLAMIALGAVMLYGAMLPPTAEALGALVGRVPALDPETLSGGDAQAIVVLASGRYHDAPEYGRSTSDGSEMERLRYAAYLHRKTRLPICVIGGDPFETGTPQAELMSRVLTEELQVPVRWKDGRSRHTFDNAKFAWDVLGREGIKKIFLVSHAWHLPRATWAFREEGFEVIPAPTAFYTTTEDQRGLLGLVPNLSALVAVQRALHEIVGMLVFPMIREGPKTEARKDPAEATGPS